MTKMNAEMTKMNKMNTKRNAKENMMKVIALAIKNNGMYNIDMREIPLSDLRKLLGLAAKVHTEIHTIEVMCNFKPELLPDGSTTTAYILDGYTVVNDGGRYILRRKEYVSKIYNKIVMTSLKGDSYVIARHRMDNTYYILREYDYVPYVVRCIMAEDFPSAWKRIRKAGYIQESCNWSDAMIEGAIVDYHNGINRKRDVNEHLHEQLPGLFR